MTEWGSIDSAPKDGTLILIGKWIDFGIDEPFLGWWIELVFFEKRTHRGKIGSWVLTSGDYCDGINDSRRSDYTHWCPLPGEPPK